MHMYVRLPVSCTLQFSSRCTEKGNNGLYSQCVMQEILGINSNDGNSSVDRERR